jgi:hypothetical protein
MQGDAWRDAIALISTYDSQRDLGPSPQQAADRLFILGKCEPREVAVALASLASAALGQLGKQGFDTAEFLAAVRAQAEQGIGGL